MYFKVAIGNDITLSFPTLHEQSGLPFALGAATPAFMTAEPFAGIYWPPGMATGANKLTMRVLHRKCGIAQQGHDSGPAIPHMAMPPYWMDALCILHMTFSSRKPMFDVQKVRAEGAATAIGTLPFLSCADPTALPISASPTAWLNSVSVNMTASDLLRCLVVAAATAAVDILLMGDKQDFIPSIKKGFGMMDGNGKFLRNQLGSAAKVLARKACDKFAGGGSVGEALTKIAVASATGFFSSLGDPEQKIAVTAPGNPFYAVGAERTYKDGEMKSTSSGRLGSQEWQYDNNPEKAAQSETSADETGKAEKKAKEEETRLKSVNHADNVAKHGHKPWTWGQVIE